MEQPGNQPEPIRPERIQYPLSPRLLRVRKFSYLLDQSIVLPGGYRIGVDPLIGLVPGLGDIVAAAFSVYLVYEAARMGIPKRVLLKMCRNVAIETFVGEIPLLGDIFDCVWKANVRNARLVEEAYNPAARERSMGRVLFFVIALFLVVATAAIGLMVAYVALLLWLFSQLFGGS